MGNPVNVIDFNDSLATFLATSVSNGTYSDLLSTLKFDEAGNAAESTDIDASAGQLWGNLVDDYIQATYPQHYRAQKFWRVADATERDALGSDDGLAVDDVVYVEASNDLHYCTAVTGAATSTWSAVALSAATLAATLAAGNTSGGTDILLDSGDGIISSHVGAAFRIDNLSGYFRGDKLAAENATHYRQYTDGNLTWGISNRATTMDWWLQRHDPTTGAFVDAAIRVANSTGVVTIPERIEGGLGIGDATIRLRKASSSESRLEFQANAIVRGDISQNNTEDLLIRHRNLSETVTFTTTYAAVDGAWSFPGDVSVDGDATVGDGASAALLRIDGAGSQSDIQFQDGGVSAWIVGYVHSSDDFEINRRDPGTGANVDNPLVISSTDGVATFANAVHIEDYTELTGVSTPATPGADDNRVFSDSADGRLKTVDEDGDVRILGLMPAVSFLATDGQLIGTAASSTAQTLTRSVLMPADNDGVRVVGYLPETYSGKGLTVRCLISTDSEDLGFTATLAARFDRVVSGTSAADVRDYGTENTGAQVVPVSSDEVLYMVDIDFTDAELDSLAAGEPFVLEVTAVSPTDSIHLFTVTVQEQA